MSVSFPAISISKQAIYQIYRKHDVYVHEFHLSCAVALFLHHGLYQIGSVSRPGLVGGPKNENNKQVIVHIASQSFP